MPQTEYNQILNQAYNNQKFSDTLKQVDYKHVYAISADNLVLDPANNQEVITMIQKGLSNTNIADYHKLAQGYNISLYTYDNHQMKVYNVNSAINKDLTRYISQYANDCIRHEIIDKNPDIDHIQNIYVSGSENVAFDSINDYLIGRAYSEIYVFIKDNINRTCDLTKDYININITYKNKQYDFYTNNIEGFNKVLDAKKQQIKDTPEYQEALKLYEDDNNG